MTTIAPWCASGPYAWPRCRHQRRSARRSKEPAKRVPESRRRFGRRVNKALDDPKLQGALIQAMTGLRSRREAGFKSFDFATGRADLKQRRLANLERLPELVERFTERLEAVGGKVHFAKDAAAAREIIGQICWNAAGGQHRPAVTKGKSMASEEIALHPYLESFGIDKVVGSLDVAVAMLRMLPRSGTGQIMTSYVNWITGPSRSADIEQSLTIGVHGPREMHCVILDNGREEMRADPVFHDALTCIRCGACSNACPAFMAVGGHQFGHIYNGPIGIVLTPFHHGLDEADLPNTLCTQCNACQEICPVDIPLPRQILEHRRKGRKSLRKKAVLGVWKRPELANRLLRTGAPFSGLVPGAPRLARVPYRARFRDSTRFALELLARRPDLVSTDQMSLKIAYHDSCQTLRQLGLKSEPRQLLDIAGYEVVDLPDIANCCGFGGTFSLEWPRVAERLAEGKLSAIAKTGCEGVASDNPGCLMHIAAAARKRGMKLRIAQRLALEAQHP